MSPASGSCEFEASKETVLPATGEPGENVKPAMGLLLGGGGGLSTVTLQESLAVSVPSVTVTLGL